MAEAAIGVAIGLAAATVLEVTTFAAQMLGMPAGYGYAQTIDPNSEADSGILQVVAQLMAGMLFFAMGMDGQVLRLIAVGKSMKEVADEMALSEKTVATYRTRISEKAGLKTNVEIARYALKHGLVE